MSSLDLADELEARATALRAEARLEAELDAAKRAYLDNPTDDTKAAKDTAAQALAECRSKRRSAGVAVGGDAYVTPDGDIPQSVQPIHLTSSDNGQEV